MLKLASRSTLSLILVFASAAAATGPNVLTSFGVNQNGGTNIFAGVIMDAGQNLYGATANGGAHGSGVVFKLNSSGGGWDEMVLYSFRGGLIDGASPHGPLTWDGQSSLFGTTTSGGGGLCPGGCGIVFQLAPAPNGKWIETVVHHFTGGVDGAVPYAGLTLDAAGNLYGATSAGGQGGLGVVYKLAYSTSGGWTQTVLHSFAGGADGATPFSAPIIDQSGNLYGATYYGGSQNQGTVYRLTPTSSGPWTEQILYAFKGGNDGSNPSAGLLLDPSGNLYGTTVVGGSANLGTAFELNAASGWHKTLLHNFLGLSGQDGANPNGLIFDAVGNLWGTTVAGGLFNPGTIFELSPRNSGAWQETVVYSFTGGNDGAYPSAGLFLDPTGRFYGTTLWGGPAGHTVGGVVFEFAP